MNCYTHIYFTFCYVISLWYFCCATPHLNADFNWFSRYKNTEEQLIELTPKQIPCTVCINHVLPGSITLKGWHHNHIAVTVHKKTNIPEDAARIHCTLMQQTNGTVTLTTHRNDELHKQAAIDLTIHIPVRSTVMIDTSEDVTIENTFNTVRVKTITGAITTDTTHGLIHAQVETGDVTIENAHGPIDIHTQKGSIIIKNSHHSIRAETERGSIQVQSTKIPSTATLNLTTHKHGTVTLTIPESAQARIVADTTRGIITSDVLITVERHTTLLNTHTYKDAQKHVNGIIGEQGNANIIINSARGVHIVPTM